MALSTASHAGGSEMLYVKLVVSGAKVEDENWKLYGWPTRATVGTCELKGKAKSGVAKVDAILKQQQYRVSDHAFERLLAIALYQMSATKYPRGQS